MDALIVIFITGLVGLFVGMMKKPVLTLSITITGLVTALGVGGSTPSVLAFYLDDFDYHRNWFSITVLNSGLRGTIFNKKNNTKSLLTIERNTTNGLISQIGAVNTSPISMTILNTVSIAWYCVCCTVNGTLVTGYLNGSQVNTANLAAALDTSSDYMGIGASVLTTGSYHTGLISSIKFYNRALSASEVLQNFNATRGRFNI